MKPGFLKDDLELTIRVDMNAVLKDFKENGFYKTYNGEEIDEHEFKGVFVAGNTPPLSWSFNSINNLIELKDKNGDGIYETVIKLKKEFSPEEDKVEAHWKLQKDISSLPSYNSSHPLLNALYNKALEEMLSDVREDGAFMAGEKWPGVWTRDISYSILLSFAIIAPDASMVSLKAKVKNGRIIQDTGTGGAWPVSSDRMTWTLAAWEVYKITGDRNWLKYIYETIRNSAEDDLLTIYDKETGLFNGESSFLDWREQTYPVWMDPKDIYVSKSLGTNAVHYNTYKILSEISRILNKPYEKYEKIAEGIKNGINKFLWMEDKGYYGQYLYGRNFLALSTRSEALGEALTVLFDIPEQDRAERIINCTPVTKYGVPCIYPQIPGIPPYHNDAVWPFVEAFRGWASAKMKNKTAVEYSLAGIYRAAALFGTNKENFVATTGDYIGTEINSSRQLWSVAGNLATVYRIIFGLNFDTDSLTIKPFVPEKYKSEKILKGIHYREAVLNIKVNGFGNEIETVKLDGSVVPESTLPGNLKGEHTIEITLKNNLTDTDPVNVIDNAYSPEMPVVQITGNKLQWNKVPGAVDYDIYKNGKYHKTTKDTIFNLDASEEYLQYQVLSRDKSNRESFLTLPLSVNRNDMIFEAEDQNDHKENTEGGFTGKGYVRIDKDNNCQFKADLPESGEYLLDFRYANGNGPINTSNKCAVRNLHLNNKKIGAVVFPQRGDGVWNDWGYSNSIKIKLQKGTHEFVLSFSDSNNNMNYDVNTALVDHIRILKL